MSLRARHLLVGAVVGAAYVVVGLTTPFGPARPLLDATTPQQPYQWVNPDPLLAGGNRVPHAVTLTVELSATDSTSIVTPDGQAGLTMPPAAFAPKAGETEIAVLVEPLDPATIGRPPSGQRYDGNAYRITATYAKTKAPATLAKPVSVILRFPILATKIYRRDGETWVALSGSAALGSSQQVYAETPTLGTFVAASLPLETDEEKKSFPTALVVSIITAALVAVAGLLARMRAAKRRKARARKSRPRRPPPKRR